jgi:Ca2+-binding RTX toxin-like protein
MSLRSLGTPFFGSTGLRPLTPDWTDEFVGTDSIFSPEDTGLGVAPAESHAPETLAIDPSPMHSAGELRQPGAAVPAEVVAPATASEASDTDALPEQLGVPRLPLNPATQGGSADRNGGNSADHQDGGDAGWPVVMGGTVPDGELHVIGDMNDGLGPIYALPRAITAGMHSSGTSGILANSYYDPSAIPYLGGTGDDVLTADDRASILLGGDGNDTLTGGASRDIVYGNAGNDRIEGGGGDDLLAGGMGSDTFVFKESWGADILFDFQDAQDIIAFSKSVFGDFADLQTHMQQVGEDVVIKFDDANVLTIKHTSLGQLGSDDFSFF